ncbi:pimeloyl-ACP methyl ester carboxylesterase [Tardiphaga robiniae]|jgi:pimeloyl-ACP methyl ester carboxylesterase|uniref:alpha/beta fold hydrolase n=1 Tax=Tardiphaga robiniae TaxID=943830 RepID=UPI00285B5634|nr:alpha/beta fold hydrolase [Tardiphaga robiniae]MDR6659343.1 pimeloyl-ACP methyl ester carboxylesterase [Tardiphaga robiniae]
MDHSRRTFLSGAAGIASFGFGTAYAAPQANAESTRDTTSAEARDGGPAAAREPFAVRSADGVTLAGEAQGDSQASEILFIHGLRQSRLSWEKQFADPALAGFRMVGFDLRGHGDSDKPTSFDAYSEADRWADDVAAVIAGSRLRRPDGIGDFTANLVDHHAFD